eukprot:3519187-Pleurochrysis_carterae.AAC.1
MPTPVHFAALPVGCSTRTAESISKIVLLCLYYLRAMSDYIVLRRNCPLTVPPVMARMHPEECPLQARSGFGRDRRSQR